MQVWHKLKILHVIANTLGIVKQTELLYSAADKLKILHVIAKTLVIVKQTELLYSASDFKELICISEISTPKLQQVICMTSQGMHVVDAWNSLKLAFNSPEQACDHI